MQCMELRGSGCTFDVVHVGLQCLEDLSLGHAILLDTIVLQSNMSLL